MDAIVHCPPVWCAKLFDPGGREAYCYICIFNPNEREASNQKKIMIFVFHASSMNKVLNEKGGGEKQNTVSHTHTQLTTLTGSGLGLYPPPPGSVGTFFANGSLIISTIAPPICVAMPNSPPTVVDDPSVDDC